MVRQRPNRGPDITQDVYENAQSIWDALNYRPEDPQEGLVPLFNTPFYITPNEPVDPRDCNRYPNSPWCGGSGYGEAPIDIGFDWVADACNFGAQVSPTLGFVSLPTFQIVYRNPNCEIPEPELPVTFPPGTRPILPAFDLDAIVYVWVSFNYKADVIRIAEPIHGEQTGWRFTAKTDFNWNSFDCPAQELIFTDISGATRRLNGHFGGNTTYKFDYKGEFIKRDYNYFSGDHGKFESYNPFAIDYSFNNLDGFFDKEAYYIFKNQLYHLDDPFSFVERRTHHNNPDAGFARERNGIYNYRVGRSVPTFTNGDATLFVCGYFGKWEDIANHILQEYQRNNYVIETFPENNREFRYFREIGTYSISIDRVVLAKNCQPAPPFIKPPPPPPPEPKEPDMACCSCSQIAAIMQQTIRSMKFTVEVPVTFCAYNEESKKWIPDTEYKSIEVFATSENQARGIAAIHFQLAKLEYDSCISKNTAKILGIDDFPIKVPETLITKDKGFFGALFPNEEIEIDSVTQLFVWYIQRFDEIMGQFEIPIEIKDADPTTPGEQPKGIKLPNIAESIAEAFPLLLQAVINSEVLINMLTRVMLDGGQDKQQNFITYKLLLTLVDWAGFKTKDVKADLPLLFTPGKEDLEDLLKESTQKVVVSELDEKFGLEIDMMRFRKASGILDAVFFKKVDPNGDIKGQILKHLFGSLDVLKKLNDGETTKEETEKEEEDFENFLNDAETGFINTPGITDNTNPYGRNFANRPKIRDLNKFQAEP